MVNTTNGPRQRFGYILGALPGVLLHLLGSVVAWTLVQLNGLMSAGCGTDRPCNFTVMDLAVNGIQPVLVVTWAVTTTLAFARPLVWGRSPYPVIGVGVGISALITVVAYLALRIGAGLM